MILSLIGWIAEAALIFAAAASAIRGVREKTAGPWEAAAVFACAALIILAAFGAVALAPALIMAGAAAVAVIVIALSSKETSGDVLGHVAEGLGVAGGNLRGIGRWSRSQFPSLVSRAGAGAAAQDEPVSLEAVPGYAATRAIPSVMDDPVLGPPPEPADLASAAVPVPAPWAALAQYIATREAEDDQQLRMYSDGDAVGALAVADAHHAWADHCLNGIGLSPAYVAGVLEAGDSVAGLASVFAQIHKRFGVIYGAIKEWVAAHGPLPHKARDFLSGED